MEIKGYKAHHRNYAQEFSHIALFLAQWPEIMRALLEPTSFSINELLRRSPSEDRMIEQDLVLYIQPTRVE
ncbi:hypothetical protein J7W08_06510 [Methanococcoides orientis]|uniref:hypothetical protein n=1 Tax=Methanococcoides orientis TaxID=2822137 RepID=UPI001E587F4A|nr:hypothetical protein [Methanococcoides orientis]UGV39785.1 hypothetical protein J7W08_06510 [Methanococcoides orientis]